MVMMLLKIYISLLTFTMPPLSICDSLTKLECQSSREKRNTGLTIPCYLRKDQMIENLKENSRFRLQMNFTNATHCSFMFKTD